ncbi:MAG: pyruvate kinase [Myxococcales bacterium]|nr:pyruvate kinase [Myxococcales bacterium]
MNTKPFETRTKIVATLGPACWEEDKLAELIEAGADVCRINCSHADHDSIRRQVARVRRVAMSLGQPVAILLDLQGPKVRTGPATKPTKLAPGDVLTVVMDPDLEASGHRIGTTYPQMAQDVSPGTPVLFADGLMAGEVVAVRCDLAPAEVDIKMTDGGELGSHKGINLPTVALSIPALTDKDKADLAVGMAAGVDYVALSFVQRAADVLLLKQEMARLGSIAPVIAKIEKPTAVERIDEICEVSEGVMVARGDLGVEVSLEKVPVYQKRIIRAGFYRHRIVITATQMLDSMERNPRPTRAETTDVANAILDGTDAVMLSGETSIGQYPVEAVRVMDTIAREVESSSFFVATPSDAFPEKDESGLGTVLRAACFAARAGNRPLVIFNWTGSSAVYVSKARNKSPIYALTSDPSVVNQLQAVFGVTPLLIPPAFTLDELFRVAEEALLMTGQVSIGEEVVMVVGNARFPRARNVMKIHKMGATD